MRNIRSITSYVLVLLSLSIMMSCSEKTESVDNSTKYAEYLSLPSEKSVGEYTPEEKDILWEAHGRLDIVTNSDGLMTIKQLSGSEVNISESLYQKIKQMIDNGNILINDAAHATTRMTGDDCVANCIVNMSGRLGRLLDSSYVKNWIRTQCLNENVPADRVYEMVSHFLVATTIGTPISTTAWDMGEIMAVILGLHAVEVTDLHGGFIEYFDQNLVSTDPANPNDGYSTVNGDYVSQAILAIAVKN